jgi:tetratricopeptide (TPR) repeat protein
VANTHSHFRRADQATAAAEEALAIANELGDEGLAVDCRVQIAQAAFIRGRPDEAVTALEPLFAGARTDSRRFSVGTTLADALLAAGRPADALATFGEALGALEGAGMPALELIQADSIVVALARLDRTGDVAVALALSELLHGQYALPVMVVAEEYAEVAAGLAPDARAEGRDRAERIGAGGAMAWFREIATG